MDIKNLIYHIDTGDIPQYPQRVVDNVQVIEEPKPGAKYVLCYSPVLRANILVPRAELKLVMTIINGKLCYLTEEELHHKNDNKTQSNGNTDFS